MKPMFFVMCRNYSILVMSIGLLVASSGRCLGENRRMSFSDYLYQIGDKFDCYFTVESFGDKSVPCSRILYSEVVVDIEKYQDINAVIASLSNGVAIVWAGAGPTNQIHVVLDKSKHDKTIIKIRDTQLSNIRDYVLDKKESVKYDGSPFGLLRTLGAQDSRIQPLLVFFAGEPGACWWDAVTKVQVDANNKNVRDILTECIPVSGYNRIIWSSYTDGTEDSPSVSIRFYGPRR